MDRELRRAEKWLRVEALQVGSLAGTIARPCLHNKEAVSGPNLRLEN